MAELSRLTRSVRAGIDTDTMHGAVIPPLYMSTTFSFEGLGKPRTYDYTRAGNPTRDLLADALAGLEGGAGATVTATGMAAVTAVVLALGGGPDGGGVVIPHDCYGGTRRQFDHLAADGLLKVSIADLTQTDQLEQVLAGRPALVWVETPSNPLLRVTDLAAVAQAAHAVGALVVADNTFCTPLLQRPIEQGADVVVHSTTKYLNGHSDVVGGAVIAATPELHELLNHKANVYGLTGSPVDSWLTLRGLRTLQVRMRQHLENAAAVVDFLADQAAVEQVYYPGFGAMVSFDLRGGRAAVERFVDGLSCFTLAESLGGTESLVAHPATMTHASISQQARDHAGIGDGLLRLSIGIEQVDDLLADLHAALQRSQQAADSGADSPAQDAQADAQPVSRGESW